MIQAQKLPVFETGLYKSLLEVTCILQKREATVIRQCHDGFTDPELYSLSTLGKHVSKGYSFY